MWTDLIKIGYHDPSFIAGANETAGEHASKLCSQGDKFHKQRGVQETGKCPGKIKTAVVNAASTWTDLDQNIFSSLVDADTVTIATQ